MSKKKNCCWFYHDWEPSHYEIAHISGKMVRLPLNQNIVLVYQCKDCEQQSQEYYCTKPYNEAKDHVHYLNFVEKLG